MNERMNGWMDVWMDGWIDVQRHKQMDGWTDMMFVMLGTYFELHRGQISHTCM